MGKRTQKLGMFLLALMLTFALGATMKVTAEAASEKDVVTLNTSEIKNWEVGKEGPFKVYVNGVQVDRTTMTWNSSNSSVATCVNGKLVGKSAGTTTITCTKANGTTATCKVTVVGGKDVVTLNTSEIKNWEVGQSGPFKAYVNGVQVDRTTMTWNSSNPSVATCVNGKLVGKSAGTTTITCTKANGTTATCKVTVVGGKDVVTLNTSEIKNWEVGQSGPFKVYVNGVQVDRTTMIWSSSNTAVATCVNGKLVGKSVGTTTITCTKTNGTTASCKVTVVKGKDVVTLNASEIKNWEVGQSGPFKVYVNGVQVDRTTMTWSSSNPSVATCVNGKLVGKSAGTTTITCTKTNGTIASCKVTVVRGEDVVTLNAKEIKNWEVGQSGAFKVYVNGVQVDRTTMTWSSSNPSVATCVNGKLVGKSAGTTTITCTKTNGTTATCKVTVKEKELSYTDAALFTYKDITESTVEITGIKENTLTELVIPTHIEGKKVTRIGASVFSDCDNLERIVIPGTVEMIGSYAFAHCDGLKEVVIQEGATGVDSFAFAYCSALEKVTIPKTLKLSFRMFTNCTSLKEVTIPNGMTEIGEYAFSYCGLETVSLPNTLTKIGRGSFIHSKLSSIMIPTSVTEIETDAFAFNSELKDIVIPNSITEIGENAFADCGLSSITIPGSVKKIGDGAFSGNNLTTVQLNDGLEEIGSGAFNYNVLLERIVLPDTVTKIGANAFRDCRSMKSIKLPNNEVVIEAGAFDCRSNDDSFTFEVDAENEHFEFVDGVLFNEDKTRLILMTPGAAVESYTVPSTVVELGDTAFINCNVEEVILPEGLTYIGERVFEETRVSKIVIPNSVVTIETGALANNLSLSEIEVGSGNTKFKVINNVLFDKDMTRLIQMAWGVCFDEVYTVPKGVKEIGMGACAYARIKGVIFPNGLEVIGESAFMYSNVSGDVVIPSSVTTIGENAFDGCNGMKSITVPSSVTSIGFNAFPGYSADPDFKIITTKGSLADSYAMQFGVAVEYQ